jgi:hypothetical protein
MALGQGASNNAELNFKLNFAISPITPVALSRGKEVPEVVVVSQAWREGLLRRSPLVAERQACDAFRFR